MAGKYGIGARVRDNEGDEGVIVGKRRGAREVEYDRMPFAGGFWFPKSFLTPLAANDDTPARAEQEQGEPAENKFKVGDRVRLLTDEGEDRPAGSVGTVDATYGDCCRVEFDAPFDGWNGDNDNGRCWHVNNDQITLITEPTPDWQPKVGDRVRMREDSEWYCPTTWGAGTLVEPDEDSNSPLAAVFDGDDFKWALRRHDIEPLPIAAEAQEAGEPEGGLTIQAGKFYKTRDGRKVGPIYRSCRVDWPWESEVAYHKADGTAPYLPHYDLIAEWVDEPKGGVTAIFDELEAWMGEDNPVAVPPVAVPPVAVAPATATPIKKRDLVMLARPAMVTGFDPNNPSVAHLLLASGGTYTLPVAALVPAA